MIKRIIKYSFLLFLSSFFVSNVYSQQIEKYNFEVKDKTKAQITEEWVSNIAKNTTSGNPFISIENFVSDGDETNTKPYLYYYYINRINDYFSITIQLDGNEMINTAEFDDIRLFIDYAVNIPVNNLIKRYSLAVYAIDTNDIEHGPFMLDDYESTGYYKYYRDGEGTYYFRGYNLVTDTLKENGQNYTIAKLIIIPFKNLPLEVDSTKTFSSDWRKQADTFHIAGMKIIGYKNETYKNPDITYKSITPDEINEKRIAAAHRIYDLATIKWSPSIDMSNLFSDRTYVSNGFKFSYSNSATGEINKLYRAGEYYYGPPYTQRNRVMVEKFYSQLNSDILNVKTTDYYWIPKNGKGYYDTEKPSDSSATPVKLQEKDFVGVDCAGSVLYSLSKYFPLTDLYLSETFIWDRNKTKLLGGLNIRGDASSSRSVYDDLIEKYLTGTRSSSLDNQKFAHVIDTRIKSNTKRVWILDIVSGQKIALGYVEIPAIDDPNEQLKLYVENINLTKNKEAKVTFKYYIRKAKTGTDYDEHLNVNNVIVNFCTDSNTCFAGETSISNITDINSSYESQEVTSTYIPSSNITKIEIIPYGTENKKGRVFILDEIKINVDSTLYYENSAFYENEIYNFSKKSSSALIDSNYIDALNNELTSQELIEIKADYFARQDIYRGYQELMIGDVSATHSKEWVGGSHIRLITGNTHVECMDGTVLTVSSSKIDAPHGSCDDHIGINPAKSYYIRTDISSSPKSSDENHTNEFGGLINGSDYVAAESWIPNNPIYTDVQRGDIMGEKRSGDSDLFLQGKNLNYHINYKESFATGLDNSYLPITLNDYDEMNTKIENVCVTLKNPNTYGDIKRGLKGSLHSNYQIISINIFIKDNEKNTQESYKIYPNHRAITKENIFVNDYSLFYNLPDDNSAVNEALENLSDNYEVKVTVEAGEKEIEVLNLIPKEISNIEVTTRPTKTTYIQNYQELDLTGGILTVTYNDGTTSPISLTSNDLTVSGFDNTTLGTKTITVAYEGFEDDFQVEVISKQVTGIEVTTEPTKRTYIENYGELDLRGGILTISYNNNSTDTVSLEGLEVTGFDNTRVGTKTITVNYLGHTATFNVEVVSKQLTGIEIESLPEKLEYIVNYEELELLGGTLKITYNNNSTDTVSLEGLEVTGFDNTTLGTKTLTVHYLNFTTTFDVEIVDASVTKIEVETKNLKKIYIQNYEELDLTGGKLKVTYNNGTTSTIGLDNKVVKVTGFDNSEVGEVTLQVEYLGQTTTYKIEIISKQVIGIEIEELPLKTKYIKSKEELDLTGGKLKVIYTDETTDLMSLTNEKVSVTGFDNSSVGSIALTVSYLGHRTTFEVEIIDKTVTKIEIEKAPLKNNYIRAKEELDLTGGVLKVTYEDGSTALISMTNDMVKASGYTNEKAGKIKVKLEYFGQEEEIEVEVIPSKEDLTVSSPDTGISFNIKTIFVALLLIGAGAFISINPIKKRLKSS